MFESKLKNLDTKPLTLYSFFPKNKRIKLSKQETSINSKNEQIDYSNNEYEKKDKKDHYSNNNMNNLKWSKSNYISKKLKFTSTTSNFYNTYKDNYLSKKYDKNNFKFNNTKYGFRFSKKKKNKLKESRNKKQERLKSEGDNNFRLLQNNDNKEKNENFVEKFLEEYDSKLQRNMKNMKANLGNNNNYKNIKASNMTKSLSNNNNINDNYLNSLRFKNVIRLNNKEKIYNYLPFLQSSSKDKISPPQTQKQLLVTGNFNITNTINSTGLNQRSESLGIKNIHQFYYNLHTLTKYNNNQYNSNKKNNITHASSNPIINSFNNNLTTNSNISNAGNNNIIFNNMGSVNTNNYYSNENSKRNNYLDGNSRANTAGSGVENDYNNHEKKTLSNKLYISNTPENNKIKIIDENTNKNGKNLNKNINIIIEDNINKDKYSNITKNNIKERALTVPYKNRKKYTINIDCKNNQNKDTKLVNEDKINFNEFIINKNFKKDKLSKYEIGEVLGKGAYAIVKIVRNKITNMKFAMKIYEKENLNSNSKKACVLREIQILKKIDHKNIAKLIEVINTDRKILIIQELIEGISLREYYNNEIRNQKGISIHKENIFKTIFRQIFDAMNYLHKHGMAHRDIKLENILIKKNYEIKIIDFGFGMYNPENKLQKFFCGTPNYMPPEIAEKKPYNGQLADMWSLGILVYKIFCADFPFKGKDEKELYKSIKIGKFTFTNYTPEYAKKIINSLIVQDPNKRITCEDVLNSDWLKEN